MGVLKSIGELVGKVADYLASARDVEFTCGDCERWERCGLTATEHCVFRAEQLARRDRRLRHIFPLRRQARPFY